MDKQGYTLDVKLDFDPNPATVIPGKALTTLPLVNTSKFGSEQTAYDGFARAPLTVNVALDEPAANAVLHYTATGHGGHGTGDEFVRCAHHVTWDGDTCLSFTPWRDDCASFRRFNPTSGVWMERTYWKETASMNALPRVIIPVRGGAREAMYRRCVCRWGTSTPECMN